jgi:ribosomal protein S18 acetylase RimI-like enzyme
MDNLIIRDAKEEDVHEMALVRQRVWNTTYRGIYDNEVIDNFDYPKAEASFKTKISKSQMMFKVAVLNDNIIGYVCFGKTDQKYKDYDWVINYIHILKEYQGRGLGRTFFHIINDYAMRNNIDKYYVECNKSNFNAHKFYEKMGGIRDHVDDDKGNKKEEQVIYVYKVGSNE